MASTVTGTTASGSLVFERRSARVHKYHWPAIQLNIWMIVMLIAASLIIGVFATFMQTQTQLQLASPWYVSLPLFSILSPSMTVLLLRVLSRYFGYSITVASLCIVFILILLYLIYNRRLLPSIVLIGGFILFILWLVALIVISIQLWGANGVGSNCNLAVFSQDPRGQTLETLAWLEQKSICQQWQAVFAFALVGEVFLLWICVMAYQVFADDS